MYKTNHHDDQIIVAQYIYAMYYYTKPTAVCRIYPPAGYVCTLQYIYIMSLRLICCHTSFSTHCHHTYTHCLLTCEAADSWRESMLCNQQEKECLVFLPMMVCVIALQQPHTPNTAVNYVKRLHVSFNREATITTIKKDMFS